MSSMRSFFFSCLGLLSIGFAHADGSITGQYQLHVSADAARINVLVGKAPLTGSLALHVTGRFTLEVGDKVSHGLYRVEDDHLTLSVDDGRTLGGTIRDGHVTLAGLDFDRGASEMSARHFPTDASTGRLRRVDGVLTIGDPAPAETAPRVVIVPVPVVPPAVFAPDPVTPVIVVAPKVVRPRRSFGSDDCCGGWTVHRNGLEVKGQRMDLRKDGTFRFSMAGATSEGTWTLEEEGIVLVYTKIDGQPLEEGASGRKCIPIADDGSAFQIDTYRYERATDK